MDAYLLLVRLVHCNRSEAALKVYDSADVTLFRLALSAWLLKLHAPL